MFINQLKALSPHKKLKILSRTFIGLSIATGILVFSSLAITASNYMITHQFNTDNDIGQLQDQYPSYLLSQRVIIAINVVLLLLIPLLVFSVFTFQKRGNLIISILYGLMVLVRWTAGLVLLAWGSNIRDSWTNLWDSLEGGSSPKCLQQSCGDSMVNYVVCGKLQMWDQLITFQLIFVIMFLFLVVGVLILAQKTNQLDFELDMLNEEQQKL